MAFAKAQVGKPYVWGANGPDQWDCSGLVRAAYQTAGIPLPRVTSEQIGAGQWEPASQIQPGDLVFRTGSDNPQPGHVGIYVGDGQVVDARGKDSGVLVSPLAAWHAKAVIRPSAGPGVNDAITRAASSTGLPRVLLVSLLWQESGFNPTAGSPVGAQGIAQFMPATAKGRGVDPWNPQSAIPGMARMIADLVTANGGSVDLALAGYNAGQGAVEKFRGIPPYPETQNYVRSIEASSGISGHIDLHPAAPPAPSLAEQVATQAVTIVSLPPLPRTAVDWVHDTTIAALLIALGLVALRRFAPRVWATWRNRTRDSARRAVRRAATPPRPTANPGPGWFARSAAASAVSYAQRRAVRAAAIRNGSSYYRTRVRVEPRRRVRPAPQAYRRPTATGATTARPTATSPQFAQLIAAVVLAVQGALRWLRSFAASRPQAADPFAFSGAMPTATGPQGGRPIAVPPQAGAAPAATPQPTTATPPRSTLMPISHPYDLAPQDHLTDPVFAAAQRLADAFESLDLSDGRVVASSYMVATELLTGLSGALSHLAAEAARRGLARPVHTALGVAADQIQDAADSALRAEKALFELHDTFFTTDISKPVQRIGA